MDRTDPTTAETQGFVPLAGPYVTKAEKTWLERVVADLQRGNIAYKLVRCGLNGTEVWRTRKGLKAGSPSPHEMAA